MTHFVLALLVAAVATARAAGEQAALVEDRVLAQVDASLLSTTIEISQLYIEGRICNLSSPVVQTLARQLEPTRLRVGGTRGDTFLYDMNGTSPPLTDGYTAYLTGEMVDLVGDFAAEVGAGLVLGANLGQGPRLVSPDNTTWTPDNLQELLDYVLAQPYADHVLGFEAGNEPNLYPTAFGFHVTPQQFAADFVVFREAVKGANPDWLAVATDEAYVPALWRVQRYNAEFLDALLALNATMPDALTYHFYPEISDRDGVVPLLNATVARAMSPRYLDQVRHLADKITPEYRAAAPDAEIWLGETDVAVSGGQIGISDRFVDGFEWLDKLGTLAQHGHDVVFRQTLCRNGSLPSFNYALIEDETPRPSYFTALVFKRLVGPTVLNATAVDAPDTTRVYGYCARDVPGGVVLSVINLSQTEAVQLSVPAALGETMQLYVVTALDGDMTAKTAQLNGEDLVADATGAVPPFKPVEQAASDGVALPPGSFAFAVFPEAAFSSCQ